MKRKKLWQCKNKKPKKKKKLQKKLPQMFKKRFLKWRRHFKKH